MSAAANSPAEKSKILLRPILGMTTVAIAGPANPPKLRPVVITPNRRFAWLRENKSAMKLQNTEVISRLKILTHM